MFGIDASLAGVQNSDAQHARNCATYSQVRLFAKPTTRFTGIDRYSTALTTSPTTRLILRSRRSATAPARGPKSKYGSSEVIHTPPTAIAPAVACTCFPVSPYASAESASRLSQSPRLDSDVAIHSRRNDLIDSTPSWCCPNWGLILIVQGYRDSRRRAWGRANAAGQVPAGPSELGAFDRAGPARGAAFLAEPEAGFLAEPEAGFLAEPAGFLAEPDLAEPDLAEPDLAEPDAGFLAEADMVLRAGAARRFGAGPEARRAASNSAARCGVTDSGRSPLRSEAFVSPSVTYGPNRPSRSTIGCPLAGSSPSSRSGGAAAALAALPRCFGCANSSLAWSSVSVNNCSSDSSDRLSVPFLAKGPYRPFCTVTGSPSSSPIVRGSVSSFSASSSVTLSGSMAFSSDAVRGLADAGASCESTSVTYGPNRPARAKIVRPLPGSVPRILSPLGRPNSSSANSGVSSSGAVPSGTFTRWP